MSEFSDELKKAGWLRKANLIPFDRIPTDYQVLKVLRVYLLFRWRTISDSIVATLLEAYLTTHIVTGMAEPPFNVSPFTNWYGGSPSYLFGGGMNTMYTGLYNNLFGTYGNNGLYTGLNPYFGRVGYSIGRQNKWVLGKSFGKLRLRVFQPYRQILCMSKHVKGVEGYFDLLTLSTCFNVHNISKP